MVSKRRFIIGEEWLYLKIFSGPKFLDAFLTADLTEMVIYFYDNKWIDRFFFVRYNDEGHHLRLRFHLTEISHLGDILHSFCKITSPLVERRLISQITTDTYNRELERYTSDHIEDIETIFSVDSWKLLHLLRTEEDYDNRWLRSIRVIDRLLNSFQLNEIEKHNLLEACYQAYKLEFSISKYTLDFLKTTYRKWAKSIEAGLAGEEDQGVPINASLYSAYEGAVRNILQSDTRFGGNLDVNQLLSSILHMHFNRLFRVKQRSHELVLYYMLSNYYKSLAIRQEKKQQAIMKVG